MDDYFIHKSSYVDENVSIGKGTKIWHYSHILSNTIIGKNCSIGQNVVIGPNVKIGNNCKIQNNVSVYEGVQLEDYVFCGPSMVFTNILLPRSKYPQKGADFYEKTLVKESATLGANSTILCGISIGKYAMIGGMSGVEYDIIPYGIYMGIRSNLRGLKEATTFKQRDMDVRSLGFKFGETPFDDINDIHFLS